MKTFPTLYKRTKTGAIQYWKIETSTTDFLEGTQIRKESGQLGTDNPIVHTETVRIGKNIGRSNETTAQQQAEFQAQSDWTRKHDEGYKSLTDLGVAEVEHPRVDSMYASSKGFHNLEDTLNLLLPKFNTDASGNAKPMLATDYTKVKAIKYPAYCQPKLDGVRCLMVVRFNVGADYPITFLSRSGKPYTTLDHIAHQVGTHCFVKGEKPTEFILDGEVYSDELSFQEIVSAVKAPKESSLKLKFRAYDVVSNETQLVRWSRTVQLVAHIGSDHISLVDNYMIHSFKEVKELHDKWVSEGYEGAMIRHLDGMYGQGQRSRDLLKVKEFDETEFAFKNFEFGQRGVEDLIAVCWTADTSEFRAKMIGTKAEKEALYAQSEDSMGRSLTVKHFGWTEDGLPRFPIGKAFRDGE